MASAVLRMGEHMPDIDLFPVVVNGNNQPPFVLNTGDWTLLPKIGEPNGEAREKGRGKYLSVFGAGDQVIVVSD